MTWAAAPVLIVEDNAETRHTLTRMLGIKGYTTASAEDAETALEYLESGRTASVIVLDLHLPGMDGYQLAEHLHADPAAARIPIVVFSCDADYVPGAVARVQKGTDDPDVLLDAIAACVH